MKLKPMKYWGAIARKLERMFGDLPGFCLASHIREERESGHETMVVMLFDSISDMDRQRIRAAACALIGNQYPNECDSENHFGWCRLYGFSR